MAYDDDGSMWDWRNFEDLASLLDRYQNTLDIAKLSSLITATHTAFGGRASKEVPVAALAQTLSAGGLGSLPFETVTRVLDLVSGLDADADPLASITLRDVQHVTKR